MHAAPRFPGPRAWWGRQHARCFAEHWRVGLIDAPLHTLLAPGPMPPIDWLTPREHAGYWADPFALPGADMVFAERFDERSGVGRIERLERRGHGLHSLGPVEVRDALGTSVRLGDGLHTSFPHVFMLDDQAFAVAETGAARRVDLYRINAAGNWHSPLTLLHGLAAADPAIFRWQGRLWLACTDADVGVHDNLCLFHAAGLEGPWQAHPQNPVRTGRAGARMAGRFFEHGGVLYRPGQDCGAHYGAAVVLHRVDECSPLAYRETPVRRLEPDACGPLPHGLHTVSAWGDRTLVDGKRMVFNPVTLARKLRRRRQAAVAR
jgi:hypothetical protein